MGTLRRSLENFHYLALLADPRGVCQDFRQSNLNSCSPAFPTPGLDSGPSLPQTGMPMPPILAQPPQWAQIGTRKPKPGADLPREGGGGDILRGGPRRRHGCGSSGGATSALAGGRQGLPRLRVKRGIPLPSWQTDSLPPPSPGVGKAATAGRCRTWPVMPINPVVSSCFAEGRGTLVTPENGRQASQLFRKDRKNHSGLGSNVAGRKSGAPRKGVSCWLPPPGGAPEGVQTRGGNLRGGEWTAGCLGAALGFFASAFALAAGPAELMLGMGSDGLHSGAGQGRVGDEHPPPCQPAPGHSLHEGVGRWNRLLNKTCTLSRATLRIRTEDETFR